MRAFGPLREANNSLPRSGKRPWTHGNVSSQYDQVVAPEKYRRFLSYVIGWCVLVGEISTSSSCALNSAEIVAALVEIIHPEVHWKVSGRHALRHLDH